MQQQLSLEREQALEQARLAKERADQLQLQLNKLRMAHGEGREREGGREGGRKGLEGGRKEGLLIWRVNSPSIIVMSVFDKGRKVHLYSCDPQKSP